MYPKLAFRFITFAGSLRAHSSFAGATRDQYVVSLYTVPTTSRIYFRTVYPAHDQLPQSPPLPLLENTSSPFPSDSPSHAHGPDPERMTFKYRTSRPPMTYEITIPIGVTVSPAHSKRRNYDLEIFGLFSLIPRLRVRCFESRRPGCNLQALVP
ncbi:hypothetical protein DFH09DRAFT_1330902 [Mycena vulgaris]|nr:hypothetical protein DFH09DRAFT_1330902 [Mycena vulgaris]